MAVAEARSQAAERQSSTPSQRERSPYVENLFTRPSPFAGIAVDAEAVEYDPIRKRTLLPIYTPNGERGIIAIIDGNVSVLVPSGLKYDEETETYEPARFARLYVQPTGETNLDFNVAITPVEADDLGLSVADLSEYDQKIMDYNMARLNRQVNLDSFAHPEVMRVLYALTDTTEQTHELLHYEEAHEDAVRAHRAIKEAAGIIGRNRSATRELILPRSVNKVRTLTLGHTEDGVNVSFSLYNSATPEHTTTISAQIIENPLTQVLSKDETTRENVAYINFTVLTRDGNRVVLQVSPVDGEVYSSLTSDTPGELARVTEHQDWIFDLTRKLLAETQAALERDWDHGENNRHIVMSGLALVDRHYTDPLPETLAEPLLSFPKSGWKKGSVRVNSYSTLSDRVDFTVVGTNLKERSQITLQLLPNDKKGFADIQILGTDPQARTMELFRIERDGTIKTWRKGKLKKPTPAEVANVRKLIAEGLIPALKSKDGQFDKASATLEKGMPIVARPDLHDRIMEDSARLLQPTRRATSRALVSVSEVQDTHYDVTSTDIEAAIPDAELEERMREIRQMQARSALTTARLRGRIITGLHQLHQLEPTEQEADQTA